MKAPIETIRALALVNSANYALVTLLSLPTFRSASNIELNSIAIFDSDVWSFGNVTAMNEDIFSVFARDKTKAFRGVVPFYCSSFHGIFLSYYYEVSYY